MTQAQTADRPASQPASGRHQRSVRNYLLDPAFQLKYAGLLTAIALVFSVGLGVLLVRESNTVIDQSYKTVTQAKESVKHGQEAIKQSRTASEVVSNYIAEKYKDEPILAAQFAEDAKKDDEALGRKLDVLVTEAKRLEQVPSELAEQRRRTLTLLVGILALLVVIIFLAGIVFTHKIAGPIFKMKRLLREVGKGKLLVRERLRKGDELHHFFATFEEMVEDLREKQRNEIARIDEVIAKLEQTPPSSRGTREVSESGMAELRAIRSEMQAQLDA